MMFRFILTGAVAISLMTGFVGATNARPRSAVAQQSDATPAQRLEVLRSKLDGMRRSLNSAISGINAQDKSDKDKAAAAEEALKRLRGLEHEASSIVSDVNSLRAKIDKAERYDTSDIEKLEAAVADLGPRVDAGLANTTGQRTGTTASKKKKKGKFFGLFGGDDSDKYDELTSTAAEGRDRELFELAAKEVRKGNYEVGRLLFNTIITTYPDSAYLPLSKLAIADSFYLEGTTAALIQASSAYQDWLTFFPTDPLADDVMLKVAESEMRQMGLPDREVSRAKKAEQRLRVLLQQFPNSPLRKDAEIRLAEVQENLATHSFKIGLFYLGKYKQNKGALKGAQSRMREVAENYPNFSYMDQVLYYLAYTYQQEEEPDEAAKYYQRLVRDYPNSEFVEKATDQLKVIGAAIPDADPTRRAITPPERPGMIQSLSSQVFGYVPLTVSKNGVLISKDSKVGNDLIDVAIARGGQLPDNATQGVPVTRPQTRPTPPPTPTPNGP